MKRVMFDCCLFPTFSVGMKVIKVLHFTLSFYQTFSITVYCEGLYRLLYASGGVLQISLHLCFCLWVIRCCRAPDRVAKMGGVCGFKLALIRKKKTKPVLNFATRSSLFAVVHMYPLML